MRELSKQETHDILLGCTVLGTGGGGSLEGGLELVDRAFAAGKKFMLAPLVDIPDGEWIGVPYMCGALTPGDNEALPGAPAAPAASIPPASPGPPASLGLPASPASPASLLAFEEMERHIGRRFFGVMSTELGGGNTAESLYAAAMLGRVIVDADPAGLSVPELSHSTFYLHGLPIAPLAVADAHGNTVVITHAVSDERAEELVRALAVASGNSVGVVDHPATAAQMRGKVIDGAISYALKIGQTLRGALGAHGALDARGAGEDISSAAAQAIAKAAGGKVLFRGAVSAFEWETRDGFTYGDITVTNGSDEYKIWFKNENIISWLNGEIHVTVPDLICILDSGANPVQNPFIAIDENVTVFALPAPREWATKRGLEVFGPRHFGFDADYRPIIGHGDGSLDQKMVTGTDLLTLCD
jgi:DUF917 family protein